MTLPSTTCRRTALRSRGSMFFETNALAPRSRASSASSSSSLPLRNTTWTVGNRFLISSRHSSPVMPGIRRSRRTTSGCSRSRHRVLPAPTEPRRRSRSPRRRRGRPEQPPARAGGRRPRVPGADPIAAELFLSLRRRARTQTLIHLGQSSDPPSGGSAAILALGTAQPAIWAVRRGPHLPDNREAVRDPSPPLRVRITPPELRENLVEALVAGDCLCARLGDDTVLVVHRDAADQDRGEGGARVLPARLGRPARAGASRVRLDGTRPRARRARARTRSGSLRCDSSRRASGRRS